MVASYDIIALLLRVKSFTIATNGLTEVPDRR